MITIKSKKLNMYVMIDEHKVFTVAILAITDGYKMVISTGGDHPIELDGLNRNFAMKIADAIRQKRGNIIIDLDEE